LVEAKVGGIGEHVRIVAQNGADVRGFRLEWRQFSDSGPAEGHRGKESNLTRDPHRDPVPSRGACSGAGKEAGRDGVPSL